MPELKFYTRGPGVVFVTNPYKVTCVLVKVRRQPITSTGPKVGMYIVACSRESVNDNSTDNSITVSLMDKLTRIPHGMYCDVKDKVIEVFEQHAKYLKGDTE